ncbi:hypothetical protein KIL84_006552 [Mauremys mutica]|uniref:Uncharacterized protein n=1 Tax=Mauremys mutica TaxID=74926 RepID=A0A9D3WVK8_9SAUR|nr:hypothetical protein KIL84_006552 [Mauremys mutica]
MERWVLCVKDPLQEEDLGLNSPTLKPIDLKRLLGSIKPSHVSRSLQDMAPKSLRNCFLHHSAQKMQDRTRIVLYTPSLFFWPCLLQQNNLWFTTGVNHSPPLLSVLHTIPKFPEFLGPTQLCTLRMGKDGPADIDISIC